MRLFLDFRLVQKGSVVVSSFVAEGEAGKVTAPRAATRLGLCRGEY
jgi:hypothetical protein